jgi:hypothetical protein
MTAGLAASKQRTLPHGKRVCGDLDGGEVSLFDQKHTHHGEV